MTIEPVNIIHALIIWQSLLFFVVLLTPKYYKKKSNLFLALLLLTIGLHFIYNFLFSNNKFLDVLPVYSCSYGFVYGPLLFFYVKFYLNKDIVFKKLDWLHFLPFIAVIVLTTFNYPICNYVGGWVILVMLFYCGWAFVEAIKYKRLIGHVSSSVPKAELKWITFLVILMLITIILNGIQIQVNTFELFGFRISVEVLVQLCVLIIVNITVFQGLKNPVSFQQLTKEDIKIIKSSFKSESLDSINERNKSTAFSLDAYMSSEQPFTKPDLTLSMLSEMFGEPPSTISQTIKYVFKTNFSDYINSFRIDLAKKLLLKSSATNESIKEIMYDCGFNSRSVFNTVFKKKVGLTPSQFKAQANLKE